MSHRFSAFLFALSLPVFALVGCSTILEGSTQQVEFRIVGADSALCHLRNEEYYYKVYAPASVRVQKTRKELELRCVATGNRERSAVIAPRLDDMVFANVTNAIVPGVSWDYVSGAAHDFPDVIIVDFTGVPARPNPLPEYQRVLNENPNLIGLEEFRPGRAALISDFSTPVPALEPRGSSVQGSGFVAPTAPAVSKPVSTSKAPAAKAPAARASSGSGVMTDSDPELK